MDLLASRAMKGPQGLLDQQGPPENEVLQEHLAPSVCQGGPDPKAPLAQRVRKEPRAKKVPKAQPAVMASRDQWGSRAPQVLSGPQGRTETRVKLVTQGRRVAKETKENRVLQVL